MHFIFPILQVSTTSQEKSNSQRYFPTTAWRHFNEHKQITLPYDRILGRVDDSKRYAHQPNFCAQSPVEFRTGTDSNAGN